MLLDVRLGMVETVRLRKKIVRVKVMSDCLEAVDHFGCGIAFDH